MYDYRGLLVVYDHRGLLAMYDYQDSELRYKCFDPRIFISYCISLGFYLSMLHVCKSSITPDGHSQPHHTLESQQIIPWWVSPVCLLKMTVPLFAMFLLQHCRMWGRKVWHKHSPDATSEIIISHNNICTRKCRTLWGRAWASWYRNIVIDVVIVSCQALPSFLLMESWAGLGMRLHCDISSQTPSHMHIHLPFTGAFKSVFALL